MSFAKTHKHKKTCYCCGSGTHMLNNCEIRNTIVRDQWFDRTGNLHIHLQQPSEKEYEQTVESYADVIVSSTKTSGWSGLQISLHGRKQVTKDVSDLR